MSSACFPKTSGQLSPLQLSRATVGCPDGSIPSLGTQASKPTEAYIMGLGSKYSVSNSVMCHFHLHPSLPNTCFVQPKNCFEYCRRVGEALVNFVFSKSYQQLTVYKSTANVQISFIIKAKYFPSCIHVPSRLPNHPISVIS